MVKKPTFIIAGEAKAGTSALYSYLTQHPDVFMCEPKEPRYFACDGKRPSFCGPMDEEWMNQTTVYKQSDYYKLFEQGVNKTAIGEASPIYMHMPDCAKAIAEELPNIKIIILLRHPAQIAFSAYQHMVRFGYEALSFEAALEEESVRIEKNWAWHWRYSNLGFVSNNIKCFLDSFPKDQILFLEYEEFKNDNLGTLRSINLFLGLPESFKYQETRKNVNARVHSIWMNNMMIKQNHWLKKTCRYLLPRKLLHQMASKLEAVNTVPIQKEMLASTYEQLCEIYAEDIKKTQELTGLNLKSWFKD